MTDEAQPLDDPSGAIPEPVETRPASPPIAQRLDGTDCRSFAFAGAIAFTGYLCTLAPDVTLEWSGLMATSANYAAPSAPPGYPVWTLYSWLCAHLIPFSNIAWRVAVGSAVASAVACGLASLMVSYSSRILFDSLPAFSALGPREQNVLRLVCGCVAGLVLAFSGSVWMLEKCNDCC